MPKQFGLSGEIAQMIAKFCLGLIISLSGLIVMFGTGGPGHKPGCEGTTLRTETA